jgi:hypothetical protein
VETLTEKYCATTDVWTKIEIANAPPVAAFAWTPLSKGKIMILGGSDGDLIQESNWIIDFEKLTAEEQDETIGC